LEQIGRSWFERFARLRPQVEVMDVIASGPPWNMRVAVRFRDRITLPDGSTYKNEGMQYLRLRWGRVRLDQIFVDTYAVARFDEVLPARA
jgi:ketosteroid isomerase-like protein